MSKREGGYYAKRWRMGSSDDGEAFPGEKYKKVHKKIEIEIN